MTSDWMIIALTTLLPITACMLVTQTNPYHALVIRGILGAVAALIYALFGAADVALTEALVGTMLSITLYAVAVRSSMSMRIGIIDLNMPEHRVSALPSEHEVIDSGNSDHTVGGSVTHAQISNGNGDSPVSEHTNPTMENPLPKALITTLQQALRRHHIRLEFIAFPDDRALQAALIQKNIHTTCIKASYCANNLVKDAETPDTPAFYHLQTRVQRLYDILQGALPSEMGTLSYVHPEEASQLELPTRKLAIADPVEAKS